jgi:hypothetical protein
MTVLLGRGGEVDGVMVNPAPIVTDGLDQLACPAVAVNAVAEHALDPYGV